MKPESYEFRDNKDKSRFELLLNNSMAFVDYIRDEKKVTITNTEIPISISKIEDIAIYLVNRVIETCKNQNTELEIHCPFAWAVINRMSAGKRQQ